MHRYFSFVPSRLRRQQLPMSRRHDPKFVSQLCRGESRAWSQLIDHWSPHLYSYVSYNAASETDARLLLHTILSEVIHTLIGARPLDNLTTLIFSIAYQHTLHYRRQNPGLLLPKLRPGQQNAGETNADAQSNFLQRLHQFTPEMQQLLLLRYLCGVTMPELAQIVGQSEELLTKVLYRSRAYFQ